MALSGMEGGLKEEGCAGSGMEFGGGNSAAPVVETAAEATPTLLPRFFFITFLVAPTGGADQDTPEPTGRPGLEMESRSPGAGAVGCVFSEIRDGGCSIVGEATSLGGGAGTAGVDALERNEKPLMSGGLLAASISSGGCSITGGGTGAPALDRNEKPLIPPAEEEGAAASFSCTTGRLPASLPALSLCSLPAMLPMKLNDDPAVEVVDAASPLLEDSIGAAAAVGCAGAVGDGIEEKKENPLLGGAAVGSGADAAAGSFAEEVVSPAKMEGGGAAVVAAAEVVSS
mmetsp:Transcript_8377/g.14679  ORF Transcript_8377/g.14679 Transcript_8377/m.14679 type:complete len:286 (-) Transcript_8377:360-1217(-)